MPSSIRQSLGPVTGIAALPLSLALALALPLSLALSLALAACAPAGPERQSGPNAAATFATAPQPLGSDRGASAATSPALYHPVALVAVDCARECYLEYRPLEGSSGAARHTLCTDTLCRNWDELGHLPPAYRNKTAQAKFAVDTDGGIDYARIVDLRIPPLDNIPVPPDRIPNHAEVGNSPNR